jgi:hypothetical protein
MEVDVASLNTKMCEFTLARLEAMGPDLSGIYNYYLHRARRYSMLAPDEVAVASYIESELPNKNILELCAGAAQLGHLLSLMGHSTSAVEMDQRRYDFAVALGAHVGSQCDVLFGGWQDLTLSNWQLLVTINAAGSFVFPTDVGWLSEFASSGGEFIIRPRQFGKAGIATEIPGLNSTRVFSDVYHYRAA